MADVHSPGVRSANMSSIRSRDTSPELQIRQELHKCGLRFRLYRPDLAGRPDITLPRHRAVIFVNGCFWHRHLCGAFRWPKSRASFWKNKLETNVNRDKRNRELLMAEGWRIAVIWECAVSGPARLQPEQRMQRIIGWLSSDSAFTEIPETPHEPLTG